MLDFLRHRAAQMKARRAALIDQAAQQAALKARVTSMVQMLKDLLNDPRYADYAALLQDAQQSLTRERDGLLETSGDAQSYQIGLLTGRLLQLKLILSTPDDFLTLAEEGLRDGAARSLVREPVGMPRTRSW